MPDDRVTHHHCTTSLMTSHRITNYHQLSQRNAPGSISTSSSRYWVANLHMMKCIAAAIIIPLLVLALVAHLHLLHLEAAVANLSRVVAQKYCCFAHTWVVFISMRQLHWRVPAAFSPTGLARST